MIKTSILYWMLLYNILLTWMMQRRSLLRSGCTGTNDVWSHLFINTRYIVKTNNVCVTRLHEWLLGGVPQPLPPICGLGRGQSQGAHRWFGKRHPQVGMHQLLLSLNLHILPLQTAQLGLHHRVWRQGTWGNCDCYTRENTKCTQIIYTFLY